MSRQGYTRHWKFHRSMAAPPTPTFAIPITMMSQAVPEVQSTSAQPCMEIDVASPPALSIASGGSIPEPMSAQYVRATRALLKRTDRYTEANLMAFLAERYPEIPEVNRLAVVYAATAGAQTAAQLHMLLEGARTGKDEASRSTAQGAQRSLSYWNLGLMSEDPYDPNPYG